MKKLTLASVLICIAVTSVALADPIIPSTGTIVGNNQVSGESGGNGGLFNVTVDGTTSFNTFCIELNDEFEYGVTYDYTLGQSTHNAPPADMALNKGTAWLYSQFELGNLSSQLAGGASSYVALQQALWFYQGQIANPGNVFTTLVGTDASEFAPIAGSYGVEVIETSLPPGDTIHPSGQDWLYMVPDGGTTVMLLGMGLMGLVFISRRFALAR
jgi:hypothetical protein